MSLRAGYRKKSQDQRTAMNGTRWNDKYRTAKGTLMHGELVGKGPTGKGRPETSEGPGNVTENKGQELPGIWAWGE